MAYRKNLRKNTSIDETTKKQVYKEIFRLNTSPKILVGGHLMVEFEKESDYQEVGEKLSSRHKGFGAT
jgi:hypothetical protein